MKTIDFINNTRVNTNSILNNFEKISTIKSIRVNSLINSLKKRQNLTI